MSGKLAQALASIDERTNDQVKKIELFNNSVEKKHRVSELNEQIERKKFGDVLTQRTNLDPTIKVRCTKTRNESLKLHLVRKKSEYEYTGVVFASELIKSGYNKWMQI